MSVSSTHALLAAHIKKTRLIWRHVFSGIGLAADTPIEHINIDDTNLTTTKPLERIADVILRIRTPRGEFCFIVEVQRHKDASKRAAWFLYNAIAYDRYRCPTSIVVITDDPAVERWASDAYEISPGQTYAPTVLGPSTLPYDLHQDIVQADINYALLCATVHRQNPAASPLWHAIFEHIKPLLADPTVEDAELSDYINTLEHAVTTTWRKEHMEPVMEELLYTDRLKKKARDQGLAEGVEHGITASWAALLDAASLVCTPEELADFESRTPSEASLQELRTLFQAKKAARQKV